MMICENCGEKSSTIDTRPSKLFNGAVRRRRRCNACERRWMTVEVDEATARYLYDNRKRIKNRDLPYVEHIGHNDTPATGEGLE
jgi:hypothetical protein